MRSPRIGLLLLILNGVSLLANCRALPASDQLQRVRVVSSDLAPSAEAHTRRLRSSNVMDEEDGGATDEDEERLLNPSATAKLKAELEAINMKHNFRDWFQVKKTLEQVRSFLGLPATGEAVSHANWAAFQNYLKYVQEMEEHAAKVAKAAAAKQRLDFKGWYLEESHSSRYAQFWGSLKRDLRQPTRTGRLSWTI